MKSLTEIANELQLQPLHRLATRIGRQTRFAGATGNYWWSVLHHSFLVENILSDIMVDCKLRARDAARLYGLIHDLHESLTNDIPTPFKTSETRAFQRAVDGLIYDSLKIEPPYAKLKCRIAEADERAMWAEAVVLQDPCCWLDREHIAEAHAKAKRRDREHVLTLLQRYGSHTQTTSEYSIGVQDFVREVTTGVANCHRLHTIYPDGHYVGPSAFIEEALAFDPVPPFIPNPDPIFETYADAVAAGPDAWHSV